MSALQLGGQRMAQLIDQACAESLASPNAELNTNVIQEINSRADRAKEAAKQLKKKLGSNSTKVIFLALIVTDMAMSKCGNPMHVQVGTKEFYNVLISILHNQEMKKEVKNKVLYLIQAWGLKFERDRDILPLFSDVYNALKGKGFEFPDPGSGGDSQVPADKRNKKQQARVESYYDSKGPAKYREPAAKRKKVEDLSAKYQKVIQDMNLLKGNINLTNEMMDGCKTKKDLKENDLITDLLKALKEMEPKLQERIQNFDVDDEDVMAIYLLVNEDLQKTFQRYKDLKHDKAPQKFSPGEYAQVDTIQYLEPTHYYGIQTMQQEFLKYKQRSVDAPAKQGGQPAGGQGAEPGDLLGGFSESPSQPSQPIPSNNNAQSNPFGGGFDAFAGPGSAAPVDPARKMTMLERQGTDIIVPDMGSTSDPMAMLQQIMKQSVENEKHKLNFQNQQQNQQDPGNFPQQNFGGFNSMQQQPMGGNQNFGGFGSMAGGPQQPMGGFQTGPPQQPFGAPGGQVQFANVPAPKGNPFAKGQADDNMPEFLRQQNAAPQEKQQTAEDLKNMNAANFSLGEVSSQRHNPFSAPGGFSESKYNQSSQNYQNNASASSCAEFADLFQMGHKLIKDSDVDTNRRAEIERHLQYNPPDGNVKPNPFSQQPAAVPQQPPNQSNPFANIPPSQPAQPVPVQAQPQTDPMADFMNMGAPQAVSQPQPDAQANAFDGMFNNNQPAEESKNGNDDLFAFGAGPGDESGMQGNAAGKPRQQWGGDGNSDKKEYMPGVFDSMVTVKTDQVKANEGGPNPSLFDTGTVNILADIGQNLPDKIEMNNNANKNAEAPQSNDLMGGFDFGDLGQANQGQTDVLEQQFAGMNMNQEQQPSAPTEVKAEDPFNFNFGDTINSNTGINDLMGNNPSGQEPDVDKKDYDSYFDPFGGMSAGDPIPPANPSQQNTQQNQDLNQFTF